MSQINVTTIKSRTGSAPSFSEGLVSSGISTFTAAVSIAGTLTYDDVTNIDSVGIITAQSGVVVSGSAPVACGAGVTLDSGGVRGTDNTKIQLGIASDLQIYHDGSNSMIDNNTGNLNIQSDGTIYLTSAAGSEVYAQFSKDGAASLRYDNSTKLATTTTGVTITGNATATKFLGDGSALTGIAAAQGGSTDKIFWENGQTVTADYTITNNYNAGTFGPVTINNGVTVTVGSGETWTIV